MYKKRITMTAGVVHQFQVGFPNTISWDVISWSSLRSRIYVYQQASYPSLRKNRSWSGEQMAEVTFPEDQPTWNLIDFTQQNNQGLIQVWETLAIQCADLQMIWRWSIMTSRVLSIPLHFRVHFLHQPLYPWFLKPASDRNITKIIHGHE